MRLTQNLLKPPVKCSENSDDVKESPSYLLMGFKCYTDELYFGFKLNFYVLTVFSKKIIILKHQILCHSEFDERNLGLNREGYQYQQAFEHIQPQINKK